MTKAVSNSEKKIHTDAKNGDAKKVFDVSKDLRSSEISRRVIAKESRTHSDALKRLVNR